MGKKKYLHQEDTHWFNAHDENHPPPCCTSQRKVPSPSHTSPSLARTSQRQRKVPATTQKANINRTPTPTQQCPVSRQGNLVLTEEQRWEQILEDMRKCKNYDELEKLVRSITLDFHIEVQDNTTYSEQSFSRDNVARAKYPSDAPRDLTPLNSEPDGNCFPNSVSSIVYGHENHHKSIHARLIVAGVLFKSMLLEDIYLSYSRNDEETF